MQRIIKRRSADLSAVSFSADLHPLLQKIYAARNISNDCEITTGLDDLLPPSSLKGLAEAIALLVDCLQQQKAILVVGDFDADGATSTALAVTALKSMGATNVDFLVPNRFEYGYGLTPEIVAVAATKNPRLIITVDNGISSIDGVAAANALGIDVLVTDHHLPATELPAATAIINPNQPGCQFASKNLAGVGVIFYLMSALRSELRQQQWFSRQGIAEPNMAELLDLVALGTVADVVPLDHNNRILVEQGLRRIRSGKTRYGIQALLAIANRSLHRVVSADLGFAVGPRLNAAGRLDDMSLGIQCLLAEDEFSARQLATQMDDLNQDRKAIEASMQREAMDSLAGLKLDDEALPYGLCLYDSQWHQGVIGILASRVKDRFHRPVIAFADAGSGPEIKGSARSVNGLHIRDALDAVATRHPGLLKKFGGHAMAAGMTLLREDLDAFSKAFDSEVRRQLNAEDLQATIASDGELALEHHDLAIAQMLRDSGPWGQHFPEPCFDGVFYLIQQRIVGQSHLKMVLALDQQGKNLLDAIAFNVDTSQWPDDNVRQVELVYKLDVNEFRGRQSVQLLVEAIEPYRPIEMAV